MNVFLYDLLRKAKAWWWGIIGFGGLLIFGGYSLSQEETILDRFVSTIKGEPVSEDVIGMGVVFVVVGMIWKPACNFIMTSLERTFTDADRGRLGLTPKTITGAPAAPAASVSASPAPETPGSPFLPATPGHTPPPSTASVSQPTKRVRF